MNKSQKKEDPEFQKAFKIIHDQMASLLLVRVHIKLLNTDKKYRSYYANKIGFQEKELRQMLNGKWNGSIPKLIVTCIHNGVVPIITFGDKYISGEGEILAIPLNRTDLSVRALTICRHNVIHTIGGLLRFYQDGYGHKFGKKTLLEVTNFLRKLNLL